jgi:hypothetical protein
VAEKQDQPVDEGSGGAASAAKPGPAPRARPKKIETFGTGDVLLEEYRLIWPTRKPPANEHDYRKLAFANGQAALCLSGGGIRSAAFALGLLQALSRKGLLTGFHYLSTVSGGGYIGGWLQRWLHEAGDVRSVMVDLGAATEAPQVAALRENSNFITPRVGIASNDTWTAVAISGRNIALNWLLFAPLLMLVTVLPNLFDAGVRSLPFRTACFRSLAAVPLVLSAAFAFAAAWNVVRGLPSYRSTTSVVPGNADGWLTGRIVAPLVLWSITGTLSIAVDLLHGPIFLSTGGGALAAVSLMASVAGLMVSGDRLAAAKPPVPGNAHREAFRNDRIVWIASLAVGVLAILFGARLFQTFLNDHIGAMVGDPAILPGDWRWGPAVEAWDSDHSLLSPVAVLTLLGPLWLMATQLLVAIVFAGFRQGEGAAVRPDADREWLARLSAVKIKPMLLWGVVAFAVLILDWALGQYVPGYNMSLSGFVAVGSAVAAVSGGKSSKSGHSTSTVKGISAFVLKYMPMQGIIAIGTMVFIVMLFLILGRLEKDSAAWISGLIAWDWLPDAIDPKVVAHVVMLVILGAMLFLLRGRIQVNRFSLNGLYRNRLARAFLGGARLRRTPDPFTGFDPADNVRIHKLAPTLNGGAVLYPVINVALNVTASEKLAWQERKAEPFIFSPRFSGSAMLTPVGPDCKPLRPLPAATDRGRPAGAFIRSSVYGGNEPDLAIGGDGVSLATAVSISGAAASPNMGYHSSPATAFLMTLFNVRLGAWMPNPAQAAKLGEDIRRSGPNDSLRAITRELAGATDDRGRDIYLSDGGHFENLGLYEMIRRRCRFIVVSDAGADPECAFTDLGNAVRKVKIDLDVDIAFEELQISSRDKTIKPQYAFALGTIEYPESRYRGEGAESPEARRKRVGHLLYIKPSYFGELPVDVRAYAAESAHFPHETTVDQFFSESQFESYRRLGFYFTSALGGDSPANVAAFFATVDAEHRSKGGLVAKLVRSVRRGVGAKPPKTPG